MTTFDPNQHGGRTQEQVAANNKIALISLLCALGLLIFVASVMIGSWLVAMVAGVV